LCGRRAFGCRRVVAGVCGSSRCSGKQPTGREGRGFPCCSSRRTGDNPDILKDTELSYCNDRQVAPGQGIRSTGSHAYILSATVPADLRQRLTASVSAILQHPEARICSTSEDPKTYGMTHFPVLPMPAIIADYPWMEWERPVPRCPAELRAEPADCHQHRRD